MIAPPVPPTDWLNVSDVMRGVFSNESPSRTIDGAVMMMSPPLPTPEVEVVTRPPLRTSNPSVKAMSIPRPFRAPSVSALTEVPSPSTTRRPLRITTCPPPTPLTSTRAALFISMRPCTPMELAFTAAVTGSIATSPALLALTRFTRPLGATKWPPSTEISPPANVRAFPSGI